MTMPQKRKLTPEEVKKDHRAMLVFLAINAAIGVFVGLCVTAALVWFNIDGFATHVFRSNVPFVAILAVAVPLSSLLGAAAMATAIIMMPYQKKYDD